SLVRTLVQMHNGTVSAFSEGPGLGARITVRLPLAAAAAIPEVAPSPSEAQNRGQRVLIVDDNTDAAASLALLLKMEDHEVCTAGRSRASPLVIEIVMQSSYSIQLVLLSYIVALLASHVTLSLAQRLRPTYGARLGHNPLYWPWILGGAFSMGTGIWSMHFIG